MQFNIFVTVFVYQRSQVGIEMFTGTVTTAGKIGADHRREILLVVVSMRAVGIQSHPSVQRLFVLVSAHMPMSVRPRQPCSQQGYTD
jgi:hypothetical protein